MDTKMDGLKREKSEDALMKATGPTYKGEAKKGMLRGLTFQFHLLMLYAIRAFNLGYKDFHLATNMKDAEKFDDIIFCYPKDSQRKDSGRYFHLHQLRYRSRTKSTKIKASDLMRDHQGPFCLSKHFASYRKIKRNPRMIGATDEIKSLIIYSNAQLKFNKRDSHFVVEESVFEISGDKEFLTSKLQKFNANFMMSNGGKKLALYLKNSCISIPSKFAQNVITGAMVHHIEPHTLSKQNGLSKSYVLSLYVEVIDNSSKSFRYGFIEGTKLSATATHYRDELWMQYQNSKNTSKYPKNEMGFKNYLKNVVIQLSNTGNDKMGSLILHPSSLHFCSLHVLANIFVELLTKYKDTKIVKIDKKNWIVCSTINYLLDFILIPMGNTLVFYQGFLNGGWLPKNLRPFRELLKCNMTEIGLNFAELQGYTFKFKNYTPLSFSERYCGERLEQDVREFLDKLRLAFNQPGIDEMETIIKNEMAYCLNGADHRNAYAKFFSGIYSWTENLQRRYLTHGDIREFLHTESIGIGATNSFPYSSRLFQEILKTESPFLGEDVGRLLQSMQTYGEVLLKENKFEMGLYVFEDILERGKSFFAQENSLLLHSTKFYILLILRELGRIEESRELSREMQLNLKKIVSTYERSSGKVEHCERSESLEVCDGSQVGSLEEGDDLDKEQLANCHKLLGYLTTYDGRYEEAEEHFERSQSLLVEMYGKDDDRAIDLVVDLMQILLP